MDILPVTGTTGNDGALLSLTIDGQTMALPGAPTKPTDDSASADAPPPTPAAEKPPTPSPQTAASAPTSGGAEAAAATAMPAPPPRPAPPVVSALSKVSNVSTDAKAVHISAKRDGARDQTFATIGIVTPGAQVPTSGQAALTGSVRLWTQDRSSGAPKTPLVYVGAARATVGFATGRVDLVFEDLVVEQQTTPEAAGAEVKPTANVPPTPPHKIDWTGVAICGVEIGSDGAGVVRAFDPSRNPVSLVGASRAGPGGTASLAGLFHGFDKAAGLPTAVAGVLFLEGDTGVVAGVFSVSQPDHRNQNK